MQLTREHSPTVVSACWATMDWSWPKSIEFVCTTWSSLLKKTKLSARREWFVKAFPKSLHAQKNRYHLQVSWLTPRHTSGLVIVSGIRVVWVSMISSSWAINHPQKTKKIKGRRKRRGDGWKSHSMSSFSQTVSSHSSAGHVQKQFNWPCSLNLGAVLPTVWHCKKTSIVNRCDVVHDESMQYEQQWDWVLKKVDDERIGGSNERLTCWVRHNVWYVMDEGSKTDLNLGLPWNKLIHLWFTLVFANYEKLQNICTAVESNTTRPIQITLLWIMIVVSSYITNFFFFSK